MNLSNLDAMYNNHINIFTWINVPATDLNLSLKYNLLFEQFLPSFDYGYISHICFYGHSKEPKIKLILGHFRANQLTLLFEEKTIRTTYTKMDNELAIQQFQGFLKLKLSDRSYVEAIKQLMIYLGNFNLSKHIDGTDTTLWIFDYYLRPRK